MRYEDTKFYDRKLVINEQGITIGVMQDGEITFQLRDIVCVIADSCGYICPSITKPGLGQITKIQNDANDNFYGVYMVDTGEFGFVNEVRIKRCTMERTMYYDREFIIDEYDNLIGVMASNLLRFQVNDIVQVTGDWKGYICPDITKSGLGRITKLQRDYANCFYGIQMLSTGEFGFVDENKIKRCMLKESMFDHHQLVIDGNGTAIAVMADGKLRFELNDFVQVTGDCRGYICPHITKPGIGHITQFNLDNGKVSYGVRMDNGEFGFIMDAHLLEKCSFKPSTFDHHKRFVINKHGIPIGIENGVKIEQCSLENTTFSNQKLVINEYGTPIAVLVDGKLGFKLNDVVRVTDNGYGYICHGITKSGIGRISKIQRDDNGCLYGVTMLANGEFGFMDAARMEECTLEYTTTFSNQQLVVNKHGTPVGVMTSGYVGFNLNDFVEVNCDDNGEICPGITKPGIGQIIKIQRDDTNHFYGIKMINGEFGFVKDVRMGKCVFEDTVFYNQKLVTNVFGEVIGVMVDGEIRFQRNDFVEVKRDSRGYICPGITKPGIGRITKIQWDDNGYLYGVTMLDNNEFGFMNDARMKLMF